MVERLLYLFPSFVTRKNVVFLTKRGGPQTEKGPSLLTQPLTTIFTPLKSTLSFHFSSKHLSSLAFFPAKKAGCKKPLIKMSSFIKIALSAISCFLWNFNRKQTGVFLPKHLYRRCHSREIVLIISAAVKIREKGRKERKAYGLFTWP